MKRKKLTVSIPPELIEKMQKAATKRKWDLDLVVEEAIIDFLQKK